MTGRCVVCGNTVTVEPPPPVRRRVHQLVASVLRRLLPVPS